MDNQESIIVVQGVPDEIPVVHTLVLPGWGTRGM
jgi:hypothetical protein